MCKHCKAKILISRFPIARHSTLDSGKIFPYIRRHRNALKPMSQGPRGRLRLDMQIFWQGNAKNCMFIHLSNCVVLVAVAFWLMRVGRLGFCGSWSGWWAWCASMPGLKLINGNDNSTRSSGKDKAWPGPACMQSCNATRLAKKLKLKLNKNERQASSFTLSAHC